MILHYLKVALRNLWKYRTHSLISVLCLAVGITFYTVMSLFVYAGITSHMDLPDVERRVYLRANKAWMTLEHIDYLHSLHIEEMDSLTVNSFSEIPTEVACIDQYQRELPYMANYIRVNGRYFPNYNLKVVAGDTRMLKDDEVVIHENFARRAFKDQNPIGLTIRQPKRRDGDLEVFRIAGVVSGRPYNESKPTDIYFPLSFRAEEVLYAETYVKPGVDMQTFKEKMRQVYLNPGDEQSYVWVLPHLDRYRDRKLVTFLCLLVGSLILISGIINFMKFIIQMFYNRQRELAIRKCVGSSMTGIFGLLFAECFCMMTVAMLLSMCISEIAYTFASYYMVEDITCWFALTDVYWIQFKVYLVVLVVCMLICLYPVWRIRRTSVIHMVMIGTRRHVFRNAMIGVQMAISLIFVGATCIIAMVLDETILGRVTYLTEKEEEHTLEMKLNSVRLCTNLDAIMSDVKALPEVEATTQTLFRAGDGSVLQYFNEQQSYHVRIQSGNPNYFRFFKVPMQGKEVEPFSGNYIYVSKEFHEQLMKDSVQGMVTLDKVEFQIAGVYEHLHKEEEGMINSYAGTAFTPDMIPMGGGYVYFRISPHADARVVKDKIVTIIRKYVPETLPLEIRHLTDEVKTYESTIVMMYYGVIILAFISLLVVALSIYSAISMDTVSRQKEVAIRKINGATPKIIAWLFGRVYILTYLIVFVIVFPIGKQVAIIAFQEFDAPYRWDWVIVIFFGIALLIFLVTGFKIWQIMHVNPATIIKKE